MAMKTWRKKNLIMLILGLVAVSIFGIFMIIQSSQDILKNDDLKRLEEEEIIIKDNNKIYVKEEYGHIEDVYIYIPKPISTKGDKPDHFYDLLAQSEDPTEKRRKMNVFIKEENPKDFKDTFINEKANASIEVKGNVRTREIQKSYKIRFFDSTRLWEALSVTNLEKNYFDETRVKTKLIQDYLRVIPNVLSLRTRFIQLYIKDEQRDEGYVSNGIYLQIEQPNTLFLTHNNLSASANYYEAENFKFERYPDGIKLETDESYNKDDFEKYLKSKGDNSNEKLIEMLDDINNYKKDINEIMEEHFDMDNYLTWIGLNIIFDNYENTNSGYHLYRSINLDKWLFLPTDFDGALDTTSERGKWQKGISMLWDNVLHRRFLSKPENIELLNQKIDQLRRIITKENTQIILDLYYDNLYENMKQTPDLKYLIVTIDRFRNEYLSLPSKISQNFNAYYNLMLRPMPFYQLSVENARDTFAFHWEEAYDMQGNEITYKFYLSEDISFTNNIVIKEIKGRTSHVQIGLGDGIYYWRVQAVDILGYKQDSMNVYIDEFGDKYYNTKKLIIKNGQVYINNTK